MKKLLTLAMIACLSLSSCVIDSDDDDLDQDVPMAMEITAEVSRIGVGGTCEGDGTSGEADIYSRFIFYTKDDWDAALVPLDSTDWKLVQLGYAEAMEDPGVIGTVDLDVEDEMRIVIFLESYENDPGGSHDFDVSYYFNLGYQSDKGCWTDKVYGDCHPDSTPGSHEFSVPMSDQHLGGSRCRVQYSWNVRADRL